MTIAGFDPTGGAGILADIKTFEQNRCIGMAIQTANTIQTAADFKSVNWVEERCIEEQLHALLEQYRFNFVKIGLIQSFNLLNSLVNSIHTINPKAKIIWDPVLSASAGFDFKQNFKNIETTLEKLFLITPNYNEIKQLTSNDTAESGAKELAKFCKVLLKGGHHPLERGVDTLFESGTMQRFRPKAIKFTPKHGTGCVLASAITANLAKCYPLQKSILKSKRYVEHFIESTPSLIGSHT